jgi:hypothetical protein
VRGGTSEAEGAAWLIGCLEWALDHGCLDGAPDHFVESIRRHLRRIDELLQAERERRTGLGAEGR